MADPPPPPSVVRFDLGVIRAQMQLGARRAAAFVGLTERLLAGELPTSLNVPAGFAMILLPEPTPPEMVAQAADEFRRWVCTNALKELDQFLGLLLDQCWQMVTTCNARFGRSAPRKGRFNHKSVTAKHRQVLEAAGRFVGPVVDDNDHLATLGEARNCLAHNLGVVDLRRAPSGEFKLRWLKFAVRLVTPTQTFDLDEVDLPFQVPGGEGGQVTVQVVTTERRFSIGERIVLSPQELIQIAMLYMSVADRLTEALLDFARELGIIEVSDEAAPQ